MLDVVVGVDAGRDVLVALAGLQDVVRQGYRDQARERQDEEGEELGLRRRAVVSDADRGAEGARRGEEARLTWSS